MALSSLSGFRPNPPLGPVGAENPILWVRLAPPGLLDTE
jgi:hypothetical protein